MLRFKGIFVALLVSALFASACSGGSSASVDSEVCPANQGYGIVRCSYAEDFTASDLNGNPVSLSSLRDKPVFLNFWASWCGPCKSEMPWMDSFYQAHKDDIHMVAIVHMDDEQAARDYFVSQGYSFTFLYYDKDTIGNRFLVAGVPQTLFLAPGGNIAGFARGAVNWTSDECQDVLDRFLSLKAGEAISNDLLRACR